MNELLTKLKKHPFFKKKWVQFLVYLVKNFLDDNCTQKASSLTYTTLLSIVPILTLILVILSSIPQLAGAKDQIQKLIFSNLLPSTGFQVSNYINQFAANSSNLTVIGLIMLFFTTIMTLLTIETAFNEIWRVEKKETALINFLRYWAIITLAPLILGTAFIVSSTVQSLSFLNQKVGGYGIDWAVWVQIGSVAVMMMGLVGMYWFIPRCQVRFKHALVAGLIVGVIFELLKLTFGVIVDNFTSYKAVYGAFAVLPLFLLWVYISWNVILLGVEISYCLTIFETKEINPRHALFSLMDMLNVMYREHKKGNAVSEAGLRDVLGRQEMPNWYTYISFLQDNNLIATSEKDEYILKRSLNDYTFWDFYKNLPYPLPHDKDLKKLQHQAPWMGGWIDVMAHNEAMMQQNFSIPMANIFDKVAPRQMPDPKDIDRANDGTSHGENSLARGREKSGLSGGQVSDVVNEDKRIKETDKEQANGFDGTLDFEGNKASHSSGNANISGNSDTSFNANNYRQTPATANHNLNNPSLSNQQLDDGNFIPNQFATDAKEMPSSIPTSMTSRLGQSIRQNVENNIHNLGDSTAIRSKIRQLNPIGFVKNKILGLFGKKDPRIITDKDKP